MKPPRALLVGLLALAAAWSLHLAVYQVDDVFIVYRYARNLAAGNGFVFNLGERVEGVTCFLWTVVLAVVHGVGLPLPIVTPLLTLTAGLATLVIVARASAAVAGRNAIALRDLLAPALLASLPGFAYWSVGALETVPFALLMALAACEQARASAALAQPGSAAAEPTARWPLRSAFWLGLASLMRPETPVVVAAFALERCWRTQAPLAQRAGALLRWLAPIAACFVPFLLLRRAYFGDWLPNTYYAKTGVPLSRLIADGLAYTQRFAGSLLPSFGAQVWPSWLGWPLLLGLTGYGLCSRALRSFALIVLAFGIAVALEGGDWMALQRFWVPALPSLALIAASALLRLAELRWGRVAATLIALSCASQGVMLALHERDGGQGMAVNGEGYQRAHMVIAQYLREHGKPGDAVALMDVGMIGWYAPKLNAIDITGLTDRAIARAPGGFLNKQFKVSDLLARNPRFLVLVPRYAADERIVADPEFTQRYRLRMRLNQRANWQPASEYWLHLFERR